MNNQIKIPISDVNRYNTETIDLESILKEGLYKNYSDKIINFYWHPNQVLIKKLERHLSQLNITDKIVDAGCGNSPFPPSTHTLDFSDTTNGVSHSNNVKIPLKFDLNFDKFYSHILFNFVYSRHTLEDLQNPQNAFNELTKVSTKGYIETPSPLIEFPRGVDSDLEWVSSDSYRGYKHHRYIVWSDIDTNTLYFLPKYPIIEYCNIDENTTKLLNYIANNYPLYWNNYYYWDKDNEKTNPKICVLNQIDMNFNDYNKYLTTAINKSIEYTKYFIDKIK